MGRYTRTQQDNLKLNFSPDKCTCSAALLSNGLRHWPLLYPLSLTRFQRLRWHCVLRHWYLINDCWRNLSIRAQLLMLRWPHKIAQFGFADTAENLSYLAFGCHCMALRMWQANRRTDSRLGYRYSGRTKLRITGQTNKHKSATRTPGDVLLYGAGAYICHGWRVQITSKLNHKFRKLCSGITLRACTHNAGYISDNGLIDRRVSACAVIWEDGKWR